MTRRIITILLLLAIIAGTFWVFLQFKKINEQTPDVIQFIPKNATTIINLNTTDWNTFYTQSSALSLLLNNDYHSLNTFLNNIDSLRSQREGIQEILNKGSKYLTFFNNNPDGKNWMLSMGMLSFQNEEYFRNLFSEIEFKDKRVGETTIHMTRKLSWAILNQMLLVSPNIDLIQENINSITTNNIFQDSLFVEAFNAQGASNIQLFSKQSKNTFFLSNNDPHQWRSYEAKVTNGILEFYGFSLGKGNNKAVSNSSTLELPLDLIPEDKIKLEAIQIEEIEETLGQISNKLVQEDRTGEYTNKLSAIETNCNCEAQAIAFNRTKNYGKFTNGKHQFVFINYPNFDEAAQEYLPLINTEHTSEKNGFPIFELKYSNLYSLLLDQPGLDNLKYFTFRDNYLVFTSKIEDIHWLIQQWKEDKTLANSNEFAAYTRQFQSNSNWFYYDKNSEPKEIVYPFYLRNSSLVWQKDYTHRGTYNHISFPTSVTNRTPVAIAQTTTTTDNNTSTPLHPEASTSTMFAKLEAKVNHEPTLVTNHYTKEKEIFVQDKLSNIYLIDNKGKELWKKKIEGEILSPIQQIDVYRNGKLQLVFNTENKIYCLDRNGKNVDGFPVKLPSKATSPLAVFDYDKKRKYRLVIGCEDKKIYNYTVEGKKTIGWKYKPTDSPITALKHIRIKGRDYIFSLAENDKISILKRTGVEKFKTKAQATDYNGQGYAIDYASKIEKTRILFINTHGDLIGLSFDNTQEEVLLAGLSHQSSFTYADINGDKKRDIIISDNQQVKAYSSDFKELFTTIVGSQISFAPSIYQLNAKDIRIGITTTTSNEFYLYDSQGKIISGYPISASEPVKITDLDKDGERERVVVTQNRVVID